MAMVSSKPARGDEGDAGAGALEHGVGADGRAVANDDARTCADLLKALKNRRAGIVRGGEDL